MEDYPRAVVLPVGILDEMSQGWTQWEEQELFDGIMFYVDGMTIKTASQFHEIVVEVSHFLTLTLKKKANIEVIRWKLRHMCDTYRHFKKFLFEKPGISFNLHSNTATAGSKY